MENNEIQEGNKMIAEFMGIEFVKRRDEDAIYMFKDAAFPKYFSATKYNTYHEDWNMLMSVYEKIAQIWTSLSNKKIGECNDIIRPLQNRLILSHKVEVWKLSIEFIKWYKTEQHGK